MTEPPPEIDEAASGPQPHPLRATARPAAIGAGLLLASFPFQAVFASVTINRVENRYYSFYADYWGQAPLVTDALTWLDAARALFGTIAPVLLGVAALLYARTVARTITPEIRDRAVITRAFRFYWGVALLSLAAMFVSTLIWMLAVWM